jgi:Mg2+-importing ATPase
VIEGRTTFANTLKYIFITTSANFGNMVSMALASLFLPFLPLLATQVLLNNLLSDIPALAIGTDSVDQDWSKTPHRWNIQLVRKFMIVYGLISSAFDILTFTVLLFLFKTSVAEFQTGWFSESLLTEILIIFIVRTNRPILKSRPSRLLVLSSLFVVGITVFILATPMRSYFDFVPISQPLIGVILLISILYAAASEATKRALREHS